MKCYVYILANPFSRVLYTGITGDLVRRVWEHKTKSIPGFTADYNVTALVYFEEFDGPKAAISREKQIKGWSRDKKLALITSVNPEFDDLSAGWLDLGEEPCTLGGSSTSSRADSSLRSE